jgi:hypothetical protein
MLVIAGSDECTIKCVKNWRSVKLILYKTLQDA